MLQQGMNFTGPLVNFTPFSRVQRRFQFAIRHMCVFSTLRSILTCGVGWEAGIGKVFLALPERLNKSGINWKGFLPVQKCFQNATKSSPLAAFLLLP